MTRHTTKKSRYVKPVKYTHEQLDAAAKEDLENDVRCALRDGLFEYAAKCQAQLNRIAAGERAHLVVLGREFP